ncbi:MAG TPA: Ppx/GppA phosphatase family protein [Vicinamibacterales bacterium]|nr:Ppx/GppA phosphatase family protein [Vicinamibacterales bacterium]
MRLAAIDIGTNSLHMIVVRVRPDLSFEIIDREKDMVRLGAGGLDGRALVPKAMQAALQTLSRFRRLAESHQVELIEAVATSAVREAENGGEFLKAIVEQTGIRARIISGAEEARLIHLAAAYGLGLTDEVGVTVDIGGGSVEITHGTGPTLATGLSFKLGVIRLTERFVKSDPISPRDERRMVRHIETELKSYLKKITEAGFDRVIGTSGSILSVGTIAATEEDGVVPTGIRNRRISAKQMHRVRKALCAINLQKRLLVPGLEPRRADIAIAGSVLIDVILKRLGADEITLCDMSLREGIVLDYIARHRTQIAQAQRYPDVRRRSVVELAERCNYAPEHSQHIAKLALALFDATRGTHALTDREREWLEYAALLHDIGVHIRYERHHKHSYYLIRNGDLRGFEPQDVETIALVARYHRRATPVRGHEGYTDLPKKRRHVVRTLAAVLRLAESLDRSHSQIVTGFTLHDRDEDALLVLQTVGDAELELWAASRHAQPFEAVLGKPLRIESIPAPVAGSVDVGGKGTGRTGRDRPARPAAADVPELVPPAAGRRGTPRTAPRMQLVGARQRRAGAR